LSSLFAFIYVVILAPIVEELFFRGIILHRFGIKWNTEKAIIVSSLLFSILHFDIHLLTRFFLGVILSILYYQTKTLIVPMIFHGCYNFMAFSMWVLLNTKIISIVIPFFLIMMLLGASFGMGYLPMNWPSKKWRLPYFDDSDRVNHDEEIVANVALAAEQRDINN
jgi:membrane protease YdiL (CAAX protease family)